MVPGMEVWKLVRFYRIRIRINLGNLSLNWLLPNCFGIVETLRKELFKFVGFIENFSKIFCTLVYRPDSDRYYNFTELACQLNEIEPDVAPTDSRRRPDQRLMEDGFWDDANSEKVRLEEKQRAVRREKENEAERGASEGRFIEAHVHELLNMAITAMVPKNVTL